jgi:hypothetical protein
MGSAGIMERGAVNVSNDINFGAKQSGVGSGGPTMASQGSQGVMERGAVNVSNDINFGAKQAGEETIFDGMSKLAMGSQGVMERSEVTTSNDINFGAQQGGAEAAPVVEEAAPVVEEAAPVVEAPPAAAGGELVKALFDYVPAEEGELAFAGGDEITVTHKDESGWWTGTCNGATGVFPANYTDGGQ